MKLTRTTLPLALAALAVLALTACGSDPAPAGSGPASTTPAAAKSVAPSAGPVLELGQSVTNDGLTITVSAPAKVTKRADDGVIQVSVQVKAVNADGATEKKMPVNMGLSCDNAPKEANGFRKIGSYFAESVLGPNTAVPAGQTKQGAFVGGWIPSAADSSKGGQCTGAVILARADVKDATAPLGFRTIDIGSWKLPADATAAGNKLAQDGGVVL